MINEARNHSAKVDIFLVAKAVAKIAILHPEHLRNLMYYTRCILVAAEKREISARDDRIQLELLDELEITDDTDFGELTSVFLK